MSAVQLHLLVNHVPVLGSLAGVLLVLAGMLWRSEAVKRAGMAALVVAALGSVVASRSGEGAEHTARELAGVSRRQIHEHEELAEKANWVLLGAGVVALGGLAMSLRGTQRRVPGWASAGVLVLGGVGFVLAALAAHQGGLIRHPELAPGGVPTGAEAPAGREREA
jgi:drug/metabolite transporter (DMT)-like permease